MKNNNKSQDTLYSYYELGAWSTQLVLQKEMKTSGNKHFEKFSFDDTIDFFLNRVKEKLADMGINYSIDYDSMNLSTMEQIPEFFTEPKKIFKQYAYSLGRDVMIWHNANIAAYGDETENKTQGLLNEINVSLKALEIEDRDIQECFRIDYSKSSEQFVKQLQEKVNYFNMLIKMHLTKMSIFDDNRLEDDDISNRENCVFIVHGHDENMKLAVSDAIRSFGLKPIILHEQLNHGRTIIEKFEDEADKVRFAVILISPDDEVNIEPERPYRVRQNVILELGYFFAKYGRSNLFVLCNASNECKIELPSDILGILYNEYEEPYGNWRLKLAKSLKKSGYNIDLNLIMG